MTLAKLLGESDKKLAKVISGLEGLSGYNSEDVRLLAEVRAKAAAKIAELGLDPADTTGPELYHALQAKLRNDAARLAYDLDFNSAEGIDACMAKLVSLASQAGEQKKVLALRHSAVKSLLRDNPPKKVMKRLNYRSVESILKRGDLEEIMAAAHQNETNAWRRSFARSLSKLTAADFELRPIKYLALSSSRWADSASRPVTRVPLTATVAVWPSQLFTKKESLYCALTILQAAEILETEDFYLIQHQFSADFGLLASKLFLDGQLEAPAESGDFFHWGHLRKLAAEYEHPLAQLAKLHPALAWWSDAHFLALVDAEPVSLNLGDNLRSLLAGADYGNRRLNSLAHRLKGELLSRYGKYETVRDYLASQFDGTFMEAEPELAPAFELEHVS